MHQRAALGAGEDGLVKVELFICFLVTQDHTASGSAQGLVCGGGYYICIRNRARMKTCCHQSCDMCHIHHQYGTHFVCHFTEFLEINGSGIRRSTGNDHLRLAFQCQFSHSVVI